MKKVLIITGGSKGIGKGIVEAYLKFGYYVISIARTTATGISSKNLNQIEHNLNDVANIKNLFNGIFKTLNLNTIEAITLINNAGTLGNVTTLDNKTDEDIIQNIQLNLTAVLLCTSTFIKNTAKLNIRKRIIAITSGAGSAPYFGWATYCATKAAVNMMVATVALEQNQLTNGVKLLALSPGVVDTEMQTKIRNSNKSDFIDVEKFIALKDNGNLASTKQIGLDIYQIDHDDNYLNGTIAHVREFRG